MIANSLKSKLLADIQEKTAAVALYDGATINSFTEQVIDLLLANGRGEQDTQLEPVIRQALLTLSGVALALETQKRSQAEQDAQAVHAENILYTQLARMQAAYAFQNAQPKDSRSLN